LFAALADIHQRLADIGAHSAPARAAGILAGLGFSHADQQRPCAEFSGGWRMRVALAATLFAEPDLLLLDEPTNYLDLEGTLWLEDHLARYPRTVIVVSHDRDLLDNSVDSILHLEGVTPLTFSQFARRSSRPSATMGLVEGLHVQPGQCRNVSLTRVSEMECHALALSSVCMQMLDGIHKS
jgi:ATPase subunit of ABC transporter with duplicated ATPase domains